MKCLIILAAVLLAALPAAAATWQVDYAHSHLGFLAQQGDTAVNGEFKKYQADIDFNPANPEIGHITVVIDMGSATTGDLQRDRTLPQPDWFNIAKFPEARFTTSSIVTAPPNDAGDKCYVASAELKIKSISHPVTLPFCLKPEGDHIRATGKLSLIRNDYNVGIGDWATEAYVKRDVDVTVDIVAKQ